MGGLAVISLRLHSIPATAEKGYGTINILGDVFYLQFTPPSPHWNKSWYIVQFYVSFVLPSIAGPDVLICQSAEALVV